MTTKQFNAKSDQTAQPFVLPNLPYDVKALEPHMTANTFSFHHAKHHNAYVTNLNNLLKDKAEFNGKSLEEIIALSCGKPDMVGIFNNAAQIWNHTFFWHSMKANGGGKPSADLLTKIEQDFNGFENFLTEFKNAGATQFGSGWAWLVLDLSDKKLKVTKTPNAELPFTKNQFPLITVDVWEHAYYLDYQNKRPDYLAVFMDKLVNWDFALENFKKAM